ncbi:MAG: hypothetical protein K0S80_3997 [Neobacillus sp.]|nr:hypothetical protein [Neobacillus sp.]
MIEIASRQFSKVIPEKGRNHDSNFVLLMAPIEKVDQENRPHCHLYISFSKIITFSL